MIADSFDTFFLSGYHYHCRYTYRVSRALAFWVHYTPDLKSSYWWRFGDLQLQSFSISVSIYIDNTIARRIEINDWTVSQISTWYQSNWRVVSDWSITSLKNASALCPLVPSYAFLIYRDATYVIRLDLIMSNSLSENSSQNWETYETETLPRERPLGFGEARLAALKCNKDTMKMVPC